MVRLSVAFFVILRFFAAAPVLCGQGAADLTATSHADAPPSEIAAAVAGRLATGGVRATIGATGIAFWWVKDLPLKGESGAPSWADVDEGTLAGAVKTDSDFRDIRGRVIKAGVYTLRYGIQPANGDHLGVSPFRDFLLLSPAAADTDPAPRGHDGTIDLSKQAVGGSHPAVWSLDPPVTSEAPLATHTTDLGHKASIMEVPVSRGGKPAGTLRFGVVLIGKIEA